MNHSEIGDLSCALDAFDSLYRDYEVAVEEATVIVGKGQRVVIAFNADNGEHRFILAKKP